MAVWPGLVVPISWLPNVKLVGENVPMGGKPEPVKVALLVPAALNTSIAATVVVGTVGVKDTAIWQDAPGPRFVLQLRFDHANSCVLVGFARGCPKPRIFVFGFVIVRVCGALC